MLYGTDVDAYVRVGCADRCACDTPDLSQRTLHARRRSTLLEQFGVATGAGSETGDGEDESRAPIGECSGRIQRIAGADDGGSVGVARLDPDVNFPSPRSTKLTTWNTARRRAGWDVERFRHGLLVCPRESRLALPAISRHASPQEHQAVVCFPDRGTSAPSPADRW